MIRDCAEPGTTMWFLLDTLFQWKRTHLNSPYDLQSDADWTKLDRKN